MLICTIGNFAWAVGVGIAIGLAASVAVAYWFTKRR